LITELTKWTPVSGKKIIYVQGDRAAFAETFPFQAMVPAITDMFQAYEEIGCALRFFCLTGNLEKLMKPLRLWKQDALERGHVSSEVVIVARVP
jgi:hypothetical protein